VINFFIKTHNPRGHIEACSFISHFGAEIINHEICEKKKSFYGVFYVYGSEELFEIISEFSPDITLEIPPENIVR
jgi:hypothetical protein